MREWKWVACLYAVPNLPLVGEGDDLARLIQAKATEDGKYPQINLIDELAGAASMLMGETGEGRPVVVIRGEVCPTRGMSPPQSNDCSCKP